MAEQSFWGSITQLALQGIVSFAAAWGALTIRLREKKKSAEIDLDQLKRSRKITNAPATENVQHAVSLIEVFLKLQPAGTRTEFFEFLETIRQGGLAANTSRSAERGLRPLPEIQEAADSIATISYYWAGIRDRMRQFDPDAHMIAEYQQLQKEAAKIEEQFGDSLTEGRDYARGRIDGKLSALTWVLGQNAFIDIVTDTYDKSILPKH
ncbi:MAG TPA: hypothetical protein VG269_09675 [Tepidisphaeraceae bacterium]|jgi:hypothetical protein|nr:hypothetical protein [Tepidisphaeraceae bacterium]